MSLRASDADRNAAVERLREAFAEGRLDEDEFDERMRTALAARTVGQLDSLFTDLPPARVRPAAPRGTGSEIRLTVAVLSGARRKGAWRVPAASTAVAVMGGCELDLGPPS